MMNVSNVFAEGSQTTNNRSQRGMYLPKALSQQTIALSEESKAVNKYSRVGMCAPPWGDVACIEKNINDA
jgi:hypothetical protein